MKAVNLKFKLLNENAKKPTNAYENAAAWDMYATGINIVENNDFGYIEYTTGIAVEIPKGYVGKIYPRSSVSNTGLLLSNSVGIIDSDYRGEIKFRFKYIKGSKKYNVDDRIGQFLIEKTIPIKWIESEELSETNRGSGGYGSSGK